MLPFKVNVKFCDNWWIFIDWKQQ